MLCSVLIPTRKRRERLWQSVTSIIGATDDWTRVEIITRVDIDDWGGYEKMWRDNDRVNVHVLPGSRLNGFKSLHVMYQEMAEVARGKYLLIWNDDAVMEGDTGWDTKLAAIPDGDFIIQCGIMGNGGSTYHNVEGAPFPIVRNRAWYTYETQCLGDPVDVWLDDVLRKQRGFTTKFLEGVRFQHNRDDDAALAEHRRL